MSKIVENILKSIFKSSKGKDDTEKVEGEEKSQRKFSPDQSMTIENITLPIKETVFNIQKNKIEGMKSIRIISPGVVDHIGMFDGSVVCIRVINITYLDSIEEFFYELDKDLKKLSQNSSSSSSSNNNNNNNNNSNKGNNNSNENNNNNQQQQSSNTNTLQGGIENVGKLYGLYMDYPRIGIVSEGSCRSVKQLIKESNKKGKKIGWKRKVEIILDVLKGLEYLHSKQITMKYLCMNSLMIDKNNKVKICNYVLSNYFDAQERERRTKAYGSYYQAPELAKSEDTPKSDMFSLGVIMHELLTQTFNPFGDVHDIATKISLNQVRPSLPLDFQINKTYEWWIAVMTKCVEPVPHRRPHPMQLLQIFSQQLSTL